MHKSIKLLIASLFCTSFTEAQEASTLDVNSNQHSTFMDGDDMIEDLSEDAALEEAEAEEMKPAGMAGGPGVPLAGLLGGAFGGGPAQGLAGLFDDDPDFEGVDDYVEEFTDKQGNHMRKEVHKGNGWSSMQISNSDGGMGDGSPFGGDDFMAELIGAIME